MLAFSRQFVIFAHPARHRTRDIGTGVNYETGGFVAYALMALVVAGLIGIVASRALRFTLSDAILGFARSMDLTSMHGSPRRSPRGKSIGL
jgi:hypothetical protein